MVVTESGKVTDARPVHPSNARSHRTQSHTTLATLLRLSCSLARTFFGFQLPDEFFSVLQLKSSPFQTLIVFFL